MFAQRWFSFWEGAHPLSQLDKQMGTTQELSDMEAVVQRQHRGCGITAVAQGWLAPAVFQPCFIQP